MNKAWFIVVLLVSAFCIFAFRHSKVIAPTVGPEAALPTAPISATSSVGSSVPAASSLPPRPSAAGTTTVLVRLHEEAKIMGITIRPIEVVEDSRCPQEVDCVWAGRIRVAFSVSRIGVSSSKVIVLEDGKPFEVGGTSVRLTIQAVSPLATLDKEIEHKDYLFAVQGDTYSVE